MLFNCTFDLCILAYRGLQLPRDAPFELKPSPEKGWGVFAKNQIERGAVILREKPLFVIRKPHTQITDQDIWIAFQELSPSQKQQFSCLRDNASGHFTSMENVLAENSFNLATPDSAGARPNGPPAYGLFLLHSRFNHSCIPNSKVPIPDGEVIASFATRDIVAGEEITFCYNPDFEGRTRLERHQALRFACDCQACLPGTSFQQLSDMRRRFIRGLQYLVHGVDLDGQRRSSDWPIIINPQLKRAAEAFSIPNSSRLIYSLLSVVLLEEEGLLDDFMVERVSPGLWTLANSFWEEENATIALLAMTQKTWLERLCLAFRLYGRGDTGDHERTVRLRKLHEHS